MTRRIARRTRTLKRSLELALRSRLLGSGGAPGHTTARAAAAATPDLFPAELEAALDRTLAEFHARPPENRTHRRRNSDKTATPDKA